MYFTWHCVAIIFWEEQRAWAEIFLSSAHTVFSGSLAWGALREGRCCFLPSQGSMEKDRIKGTVLALTALWLRAWVGMQICFPLVQPQDSKVWFLGKSLSLPIFSPSVLPCHYNIWCFNVFKCMYPHTTLRQGRAVISACREGSWRASTVKAAAYPAHPRNLWPCPKTVLCGMGSPSPAYSQIS